MTLSLRRRKSPDNSFREKTFAKGTFDPRLHLERYFFNSRCNPLKSSLLVHRANPQAALRQRRCLGRSHSHPLRRHAGGCGAVRTVYLARHAQGEAGGGVAAGPVLAQCVSRHRPRLCARRAGPVASGQDRSLRSARAGSGLAFYRVNL